MVALAEAFVTIKPEMASFRSTVERDLSSSGTKAGRGFGQSFGSGAHRTFQESSKGIESSGGELGQRTGRKFGSGMSSGLGGLKSVIGGMGVAFAAFQGVKIFKEMISGAIESTKVTRLTEAVIKSTGGAAHVTAGHVKELATSLGFQSASSGKAIRQAENLLLTFKGVRNETGAGNQIFDRGTKAIVDMTAAMHRGTIDSAGLKASTIQLGKALGDPIKGMSALTRIGVVFTAGQKEQIKGMVAAGNTLGAQKLILKEVESEFGGAAKASADPIKRLGFAWKSFETTIGLIILPLLQKLASWMTGTGMRVFSEVAAHIKAFSQAVGSAVSGPMGRFFAFMKSGSGWAAALKGALIGMVVAIVAVRIATTAWAIIQSVLNASLFANPIGLIVLAIAALVGALILAYKQSATFRNIVQATWSGIQTAAKWAWENVLKPIFAGIVLWIHFAIEAFKIYWAVAKFAWNLIVFYARLAWVVIAPIFKGIVLYVKIVIEVFKVYWQVAKAVWAGIAFAIKVAWAGIIQPIWVLIRIGIGILVIQFRMWLAVGKVVWAGIVTAIKLAWALIHPVWNLVVAGVKLLMGQFQSFWNAIKVVWNGISSVIRTIWNSGINPIFTAIKNGLSAVGRAFQSGASAIGQSWSKIKDLTKAPVNFVIGTVFNHGIIGLWNKVLGWLHISGLNISPLPLLAAGGHVPGNAGKYNRPTAIVGEGNPNYPEYVIPTDPKYRGRAASLWKAAGGDLSMLEGGGKIQMLQFGGILDGIKKAASKVLSVGKSALSLIANPSSILDSLWSAIPHPSDPGGATWQHAIAQVPNLIISHAKPILLDVVKAFASSFGGGATGVVRKARTQLGVPYSWGGGGLSGPSYGIAQGANIFGFDCSGLTEYAWGANKIDIGGVTDSQWASSHQIAPGNHPGALLFPSGPSVHVMLASDKPGMVIQAPHTGAFVEEVSRSASMWRWPNAAKMASGGMLGLGEKFTKGVLPDLIAESLRTAGFAGSGPRKGIFDNGGMAQGWPFNSSKPEAVLTDSQWSAISRLASMASKPNIGPINITGLPDIPSEKQISNGIDRVLTMHGSYWR